MARKIKSSDDLYFNNEAKMIRGAVADFVKKEINPYVDEWEEAGISPLKEIFAKMGELGFLGMRYDTEYSGEGLDLWCDLAFIEEISHIKAQGLTMAIGVQTHMSTPALNQFGSEYLKKTYLQPAVEGKMVAAIAVTEPDAGSDVAALKTTATLQGDHYLLNGSKTYVTNGTQADYVVVLARTSDEPGYHSYSLLVVPTDLPGFNVSKKLKKMGMRCSDTAELFFDDIKVPKENLIGEEGEGFIYQMQQFQHERFFALPFCYVMCRDAVDMTLEYIKKRIVFGKPLVKQQVLQHRLAEYLSEVEALKRLAYHITRMKENKLDVSKEVSMGKLISGGLSRKVVDGCLQMFGGFGFTEEALISRYYRDARLASIGGGASEVMCDIIAKMEGF
jgi:citronellyl-CoA dehydrogenase